MTGYQVLRMRTRNVELAYSGPLNPTNTETFTDRCVIPVCKATLLAVAPPFTERKSFFRIGKQEAVRIVQ